MKTRIRPCTAGDIPHLLPMVQALARHHGDNPTVTEDSLARNVLGPAPWIILILAEAEGGGLVGYTALSPLMQLHAGVRGMDMHHLFVRPDFRGRGVGRALVDGALTAARDRACRYMMVGTHPDNSAAQQFYRDAGFEAFSGGGPRFGIRLDA